MHKEKRERNAIIIEFKAQHILQCQPMNEMSEHDEKELEQRAKKDDISSYEFEC